MTNKYYPYSASKSFLEFKFCSIGHKGKIKKIARFSLIGKNIYNFGFGDLDESENKIIDYIVSNNGDGDIILHTLASIINDFTDKFPKAAIFIIGTNKSRTRLYQIGINKHWNYIASFFEIFGYYNGEWVKMTKGTNYEAFIGRRNKLF